MTDAVEVGPPKTKRRIRKESLKSKLDKYLNEYKNIMLINVDNVGSNQMQKVRIALRGKAAVLMGKNTIIRKVVREQAQSNPKLGALLDHIWGNIGLIFTNDKDIRGIREVVVKNKVPAAAKSGTVAPIDVYVPPGPTGLDPGQTSFFQALNISTKIARGSIEIINTVHLIKKGDKVTSSHVALLSKLNIQPFFYGIVVQKIYEDGAVFKSEVLDMTPEDLYAKFFNGVRKIAAISLAIGYPTIASLPTILGNGFKKLLAVSLATEYDFAEAKAFRNAAASGAGATAAPAAAAHAAGKEQKGGKPKAEEKPKEVAPAEEEDGDAMSYGGGLFD
jgi:large subunit ribosomal protein LP0